jgi:hypothetical protein
VHVDHVIYAAGPEGLGATAERLSRALGVGATPGGRHPSWGTRNAVIPLACTAYLEVVEVVDRPIALGTDFGAAIVAGSDAGGGWWGWVVAVDDVGVWAARLGWAVAEGVRRRPDGTELRWRTLGSDVLDTAPDLPFLITWDVPADQHPSAGDPGSSIPESSRPRLTGVELAGDPSRLAAWMGTELGNTSVVRLAGVTVEVRPPATGCAPGLSAVTFATPRGAVRLT